MDIKAIKINNTCYPIADSTARESLLWGHAFPINSSTGVTPHTVAEIIDKIDGGAYPSYYLFLNDSYYFYDITGYNINNSIYQIWYNIRHINGVQDVVLDESTGTLFFPQSTLNYFLTSNSSDYFTINMTTYYADLLLNGSEVWELGSTTAYSYVNRFDLPGEYYIYKDAYHPRGIATVSQGIWTQASTFSSITELSWCFISGNFPATKLYCLIPKTENVSTVAQFKSWLQTNNISIRYRTSLTSS